MLRKPYSFVFALVVAAAAVAGLAAKKDGAVSYKNVRFDTQGLDFAASPVPSSLKASPLNKNEPPGSEWPAHIEFKFPHYSDGALGKLIDRNQGEPPIIQVFPTADFAAFHWDGELKALKALLKKRPAGAASNATVVTSRNLPLLPMADAEQVLHAKAVYLSFHNGTGIRYITLYAQDTSPFTANSFFYTFQGLTNDGKTYIAVTFPLYTPLFPKTIPANFDYKRFDKGFQAYRSKSVQQLNQAGGATDFSPSPASLDRLVSSIQIENGADHPKK